MKVNLHLCSVLAYVCSSHAASVISPDPLLRNIGSSGPYLIERVESATVRYQEVHQAADFLAGDAPALLITELSYSAPAASGRVPIDTTLPNVEIRLSTTAKNPDALSSVFSDNVGANETVVYSGPLHFYETEAEAYDIHIPITPFAYNPLAGNLLLDVFNYSPISSRVDPDWQIDAVFRLGDSVSNLSGRVNDASGGFSTSGLITRFTYTPIPEPSAWAILAIGVVAFGVKTFKRRFLSTKKH